MRIHHIGYLIKAIDRARALFERLGFVAIGDVVYDEYRDVDVLFMGKDGYTIELVSPKSERSVVGALIKKYKNTPYHICFASDDFSADIQRMSGCGFMRIDEPMPAPALGGGNVCFFVSPYIGMVEILDDKGFKRDTREKVRVEDDNQA